MCVYVTDSKHLTDLHLLSAMFEVMPEDQHGQALLAATLRLVDR